MPRLDAGASLAKRMLVERGNSHEHISCVARPSAR